MNKQIIGKPSADISDWDICDLFTPQECANMKWKCSSQTLDMRQHEMEMDLFYAKRRAYIDESNLLVHQIAANER